jgi:hypothetical protein
MYVQERYRPECELVPSACVVELEEYPKYEEYDFPQYCARY